MNYCEILLTCTSADVEQEAVHDILAFELGEIGFESFTQGDSGLLAYIPETLYSTEKLTARLAAFPLSGVTVRHTLLQVIESRNWNEEWERHYFQPIRIGRRCIIRASFHTPQEGFDYTVLIDPKMAFGTGNHETTRLMINLLLEEDLTGKTVLDMGCGTAVLAILARMKGACRVTGIDVDPWACRNARENIGINRTDGIDILHGGSEQIEKGPVYDLIMANINRNILLEDIHRYALAMKPDGALWMSGFYKEDIPVVAAECYRNGLRLVSFTEQNNWAAVKVAFGNG